MSTTPFQLDPMTMALMRATQGDSSQIPTAPPDTTSAAALSAAASPVGASNPIDIVRQFTQLPEFQGPTQSLAGIQKQEQDIQQQKAGMPLPQIAPKNAFVRALLNFTGPGRAVNEAIYSPGVTRYEQQQRVLADQLANLKQQEAIPTEELRSLSSMAGTASLASYRGGELENQRVANQIRQQRVDEYGKMVENRLTVAMRGLDLKQLKLGSEIELNKARAALDRVMPEILARRNELIDKGIDVRSATEQTVANVRSQLGIDEKHPLTQMIDNWFGTGLTPSAAQAPGGQVPERSKTPLPTRDQQNRASKIKSSKGSAAPLGSKDNPIVVKP